MTGRELSDKLNYTGMEIAVRKLALKEKLASAEKIAVMSELDVCDLLSKHYELVFSESENIGLVKKENAQKLFTMLEIISRRFGMSKVEIEIPDDRWFWGEWDFRPKDKQLCVVIHKYGGQTPQIYQYRKADWLHPKNDYFLDVSEKWNLDSLGIDEWEPSFLEWWGVDRWKPIGLPADVNEMVLAEIEKWFEEDE